MDDDPMILDVLQGYFEMQGYLVFTATDGKQGMDLCGFYHPDVVLVDLNMPVMNGFQVLEMMTERYPDTPAIVISGEGEMEDVIKALHLGAWYYLTKPIDNMTIIEHAIEQTLEKSLLRKQIKAQKAGLERKLANVFTQFQDFVITCDKELVIHYMNPSLVNYLGSNEVGKRCKDVFWFEAENRSWWPDDLQLEGSPDRREIFNPNDGTWYDLTLLAILDHNEEIAEYQIIMQDITRQKEELRDLHEREAQLIDENTRLLASLSERFRFGEIVGKSIPMQEVYKTIISAAGTEASVVIYGESGTGKELVARAIHDNSQRKGYPFVCVNCGAIPENLIESEFFGYRKGAFSGAMQNKDGFLDVANEGTLFLDEVGEIPLNLQTKLLRAIEGGGYTPLGSNEHKTPDVRIIAATNKNLKELVKKGEMREDFLYRIHIIPISIPPLRERTGDIPILIDHFLDMMSAEEKVTLPLSVAKALQNYTWPGNVRELQNTIQRFLAIGKLDFMALEEPEAIETNPMENINFSMTDDQSLSKMMDQVERSILLESFERYGWHQTKTAQHLQIDRKTLYRKMKHHQIDKPE